MVYRAIGIMSDDIENGMEIVFTEFQEQAGKWSYEILQTDIYAFGPQWLKRLQDAINLSARDYQLLHFEFGHYTGQQVNKFIAQYQLGYKVALIASPGYTVFTLPAKNIPVQLGDGAAVAAITQLPVVSDFFAIDAALGGRGKSMELLQKKIPVIDQEDAIAADINMAVLYAFMGVLRWRQEYNVFATETIASRNSIGGALWTGQEA